MDDTSLQIQVRPGAPYRAAGLAGVVLSVLVGGCGGPQSTSDSAPPSPPDLSAVDDAIPTAEPPSRYGNPSSYEVWGETYRTLDTSEGYRERGVASWYGTKFHGRRTSSGERYDMYAMTAAHKSLPLPAFVQVKNLQNGRTAVVKVNDRGPFHEGRIIDLSYAAASKLGVVDAGTAPVEVVALPPHQTIRGASSVTTAKARGENHQLQPIPSGNMYLQIGAFSERANARRLLVQLDGSLPGRVRIHEAPAAGAAYRVRVGPLSTAETDAVRRDLDALGFSEAIIVFEESL